MTSKRTRFIKTAMIENKNISLESIIKAEPEQFQTTSRELMHRHSGDDILRSNAGIFSDPVVLLERVIVETTTIERLRSGRRQNRLDCNETLEAIKKESNDGLHQKDIKQEEFESAAGIFENEIGLVSIIKVEPEEFRPLDDNSNSRLSSDRILRSESIRSRKKVVHSKKVPCAKVVAPKSKCKSGKEWACNICDYKTAEKANFERHKLIHVKEKCEICNKFVSSLKSHMESHKPKEPCSVCKRMIARCHMKMHLKIHAAGPKICGNCDMAFLSNEDLRRHKLRKHYDGKLYECDCGSVYNSKAALRLHNSVHKGGGHKCEVCQKVFSRKRYLKKHRIRKHLEEHRKLEAKEIKVLRNKGHFTCDKCGLKCSTRRKFRKHYNCCHLSARRFCDLCPRLFKQKYLLEHHMRQVHLKIRDFDCKKCDFKAFSEKYLKRHMRIHGPKTECSICHKFVSDLRWHLRVHVTEKCEICGKVFPKHYLTTHVKTIHKNEKKFPERLLQKDRLNLFRYECQICDFKTGYQHSLKKHLLRHGPKTECPICHKPVYNVQKHLETHNTEKCEICGIILKKHCMSKHLQRKHKTKD